LTLIIHLTIVKAYHESTFIVFHHPLVSIITGTIIFFCLTTVFNETWGLLLYLSFLILTVAANRPYLITTGLNQPPLFVLINLGTNLFLLIILFVTLLFIFKHRVAYL
ncbi:hypothetical protein RCF18_08395, partial [Lacticaseibacillus rhamnosus]|nr:hypothetical protein [Lacticaseibacillus rhamnosus]MDB7670557.1 hypothetical protein [Lacticaseibacillus rhamnosus]MDB7675700.1 hypothetical protein [Lacticaseibacillus rhamnosus]MDB7678150.1 hypothetical protein [Lacticaseibacillus rhamnosus]MDB7683083.1 hypothetical protein [Lacticaseibacillus rhamnosus]